MIITKNQSRIRVAIVEDTPAFREGIAAMLNFAEGFLCVATFSTAEDAINHAHEYAPEVMLMDIDLPKKSGIEAMKMIRSKMPSLQFLMLTVIEDDEKIFSSLEAGASGYLLKTTSPTKLLEAIQEVKNGGSAMSAQIARRVIDTFRQPPQPKEILELTQRENEVLTYRAKGYTYKEIGDALFISEHTVRTHIHRIYQKLHVRNISEAMNKRVPKSQ